MVTEAELWEQLYALGEQVQPIVTKYTVCIYGWQDQLKSAGTGVLIRVADRFFLLSAAHVMDFTFYHSIPFYASVSTASEPPVPLLFETRDSSARPKHLSQKDKNLRDSDFLDFSLAELKPETAEQLSKRYKFLQPSDLDSSPIKTATGIYVFGYPDVFTRHAGPVELESFPMGFVTTTLQDEPEARDKDKDVLLYYPEECRDTKRGVAVETPQPFGLSGCGIWRMCQPPTLPKNSRLEDLRLVGIQHRWRKKSRYLVGTSVLNVVAVLWHNHPELRAALSLVRKT